jgi:3-oxoacyl-[acyl-carrier protein] reductase
MNQTQPLAGQVAIITGGASGIGRATCLSLARLGATITMLDLNEPLLEETAQEISRLSPTAEPLALSLDIRREADMAKMARLTMAKFGRIDILVHSAGILRGKGSKPKMLAEVELAEWDEVIATNLTGTFLCNRAVLSTMMDQRQGQIINISSTSGLKGRPLDAVYCASKFAIMGLSQSLAEEVRNFGIRVQVVAPDAIDTPMWDQNGPIRLPADALPVSRVADLIAYMVTLPLDATLGEVIITPFRTRRRKKSPASPEAV